MLHGPLHEILVGAADEPGTDFGNLIEVLGLADIPGRLRHGVDNALGLLAVRIDLFRQAVEAGAEADVVTAAGHQGRPLHLVECTSEVRLPGDDRVHATGIQNRDEARRTGVDALIVAGGDAVLLEDGAEIQITGAGKRHADLLALEIGDGLDAGAGARRDTDEVVTGRFQE